MADGMLERVREAQARAHERAYGEPLETLNPARAAAFRDDAQWPFFERLRRESPVHFTPDSNYGAFWSVTKYHDIVAIDSNHGDFSSASGIVLPSKQALAYTTDRPSAQSFITMDPPKHDVQRKTVSPALAPPSLERMAPQIRERAGFILDSLPIGEPFDWVDLVSKELTTMTLATLFDFPFDERRKLTFWSDAMTQPTGFGGVVNTMAEREKAISDCFAFFDEMWDARVDLENPGGDLISMLAHGPHTRDMGRAEYHSNVNLLIIGGNDTTRNTISGSVYALNKFPDQYDKLRANPALVPSMVSETIRWQTPLAHMSRTALRDVEFQGKTIKKGERVVMWYVSGNRDDDVIARPNDYVIDRERPRQHLSFGFGIHRCVGNRLAELQLTIIWEEILKRFPDIQVLEEPKRTYSIFVKGYEEMKVLIPRRN